MKQLHQLTCQASEQWGKRWSLLRIKCAVLFFYMKKEKEKKS